MYDTVYLAAHDQLAKEVGRKAMILLTDGEDQGSQLKINDAIEAAQKADSICYVLLIADRGFYGFGGYSGDREMKKLAAETGGRVIDVGNKADKLKEAFDQIARSCAASTTSAILPRTPHWTAHSAKWKSTPRRRITRSRPAADITQCQRRTKSRVPHPSRFCEGWDATDARSRGNPDSWVLLGETDR